ncbi:MAG: hypothetical protein PHE53_01865 [Thermoguttaceae bacterium]|nr:hypothetical protein [Thermoguttaceae bacterium]
MSSTSAEILEEKIDRMGRELRASDLVSGILRTLLGVLSILFLAVLAEQCLTQHGLGPVVRWLVSILVYGVGGLLLMVQVLRVIRHRINPVYAASLIEDAEPGLKNSLISWVYLRRRHGTDPVSSRVFESLESHTAETLTTTENSVVVDRHHLIQLGIALAILLTAWCVYIVVSPKNTMLTFARILVPWADIDAPTRVQIDSVQPGDAACTMGETMIISANIQGLRAGEEPQVRLDTIDGRIRGQLVTMQRDEKTAFGYAATVPSGSDGMQQDFIYMVIAGDAQSSPFSAKMQIPMLAEVTAITYDYPAFTGQPTQRMVGSGNIHAPESTRLEIEVHANRPLAKVSLVPEGLSVTPIPLTVSKGNTQNAKGAWILEADSEHPERSRYAAYRLQVQDTSGNHNATPPSYRITMIPNRLPKVEWIDPPAEGVSVAMNQDLALSLAANDPDYGLKEVTITLEKDGKTFAEETLWKDTKDETEPSAVHEKTITSSFSFRGDRADWKLQPGDRIGYRATCRDLRGVPLAQPTQTETRSFVLGKPEQNPTKETPEKTVENPKNSKINGDDMSADMSTENTDSQTNASTKSSQNSTSPTANSPSKDAAESSPSPQSETSDDGTNESANNATNEGNSTSENDSPDASASKSAQSDSSKNSKNLKNSQSSDAGQNSQDSSKSESTSDSASGPSQGSKEGDPSENLGSTDRTNHSSEKPSESGESGQSGESESDASKKENRTKSDQSSDPSSRPSSDSSGQSGVNSEENVSDRSEQSNSDDSQKPQERVDSETSPGDAMERILEYAKQQTESSDNSSQSKNSSSQDEPNKGEKKDEPPKFTNNPKNSAPQTSPNDSDGPKNTDQNKENGKNDNGKSGATQRDPASAQSPNSQPPKNSQENGENSKNGNSSSTTDTSPNESSIGDRSEGASGTQGRSSADSSDSQGKTSQDQTPSDGASSETPTDGEMSQLTSPQGDTSQDGTPSGDNSAANSNASASNTPTKKSPSKSEKNSSNAFDSKAEEEKSNNSAEGDNRSSSSKSSNLEPTDSESFSDSEQPGDPSTARAAAKGMDPGNAGRSNDPSLQRVAQEAVQQGAETLHSTDPALQPRDETLSTNRPYGGDQTNPTPSDTPVRPGDPLAQQALHPETPNKQAIQHSSDAMSGDGRESGGNRPTERPQPVNAAGNAFQNAIPDGTGLAGTQADENGTQSVTARQPSTTTSESPNGRPQASASQASGQNTPSSPLASPSPHDPNEPNPSEKMGNSEDMRGTAGSKSSEPSRKSNPRSDEPGDSPRGDSRESGSGYQNPEGMVQAKDGSRKTEADLAHTDFTRQNTQLALQTLEESLKKQDSTLLDQLGWSRAEAEAFLRQWKQIAATAGELTQDGENARNTLKTLGLSARDATTRRAVPGQKTRQLRQASTIEAPAEWNEWFQAYRRSVGQTPAEQTDH